MIQSLLGHTDEAEQLLTKACETGRHIGNLFLATESAFWLSSILHFKGKLHEEYELCQQAVDWAGQSPAAYSSLVYLGMILYEWNDLQAALSYIEQADKLGQSLISPEIQAWICNYMALTLQAQGDDEGALKALEKADQLEGDSDIVSMFRTLTISTHVTIALRQGNLTEALKWGKKLSGFRDILSSHINLMAPFHLLIAR